MKTRAFTLIELLVVVLIIGILTAIAVPQYQKAVMKASLHKGISLVSSLYQAQQAYYLTNGDFATDIDDLDVSLPLDESCTKEQSSLNSRYSCDFGTIGFGDQMSNIQFKDPNNQMIYSYSFKDYAASKYTLEAGKRYCYAKGTNNIALQICQDLGGEVIFSHKTDWNRYKLP